MPFVADQPPAQATPPDLASDAGHFVPDAAEQPPPAKATTLDDLVKPVTNNPGLGYAETAVHLGSAALAAPTAGIASLYQLATSPSGLRAKNAAQTSQKVLDAMTYQPHSEAGKTISGAVDTGLSYLGPKEGQWLQDTALKYGVNPYVAGGLNVAAQLPATLMGLRGKYASGAELADSARANLATRKLQTALTRDKTTLPQAAQQVTDANAQGIPARLPDVAGPNTQMTAEVLAQHPGEAADTMVADRSGTHADTKLRVKGEVQQMMGTTGDAAGQEALLQRSRTAKANANYEAVRQDATPVMDPRVWEVLDNPTVAKLYQEARAGTDQARSLEELNGNPSPPLAQLYSEQPRTPSAPSTPQPGRIDTSAMRNPPPNPPPVQGPPEPPTEWVRTGVAPDVRSMDFLIRAMDKKITNLYSAARTDSGSTAAASGAVASALKTTRANLKSVMEEVSPAYQKASQTYADDSTVLDHYTMGKDGSFLQSGPKLAAETVAKAPDAALQALREGVAEHLLGNSLRSDRGVNLASKALGGPDTESVVRTLFKNDQDFDVFKKTMQLESNIFKNNNRILSGSQTYRRGEASADFEHTPEFQKKLGIAARAAGYLNHGLMGAAFQGVMRLMDTGTLWDQGIAKHVANILSSPDPMRAAQQVIHLGDVAAGHAPMRTVGTAAGMAGVGAPQQSKPVADAALQGLQAKYGPTQAMPDMSSVPPLLRAPQ